MKKKKQLRVATGDDQIPQDYNSASAGEILRWKKATFYPENQVDGFENEVLLDRDEA